MTQRVRLIEGNTPWPYARQTPQGDGRIGNCQFVFGHGPEPADWLVVLDQLSRPIDFPANRTIFLAGEPVVVKRYDRRFLSQFAAIVTTDTDTPHRRRIVSYPCLPWHAGIQFGRPETYTQAMSYRQLMDAPIKTKLCSCICSTKSFTPSHRRRLAFVLRLQREFEAEIEFFGRGFREVADKAEALDRGIL